MGVRIRRARRGDAEELTRIAHAAKRFWGYPEAWMRLWNVDLTVGADLIGRQPVFCAVRDASIVGFYALSVDGPRRELEHMWVDPAAIRTGIGRLLFAHLVRHLRRHRVTKLTIVSDPNAEGFYCKLGARRAGSVASRPAGRRLPRLVLELSGGNTGCRAR